MPDPFSWGRAEDARGHAGHHERCRGQHGRDAPAGDSGTVADVRHTTPPPATQCFLLLTAPILPLERIQLPLQHPLRADNQMTCFLSSSNLSGGHICPPERRQPARHQPLRKVPSPLPQGSGDLRSSPLLPSPRAHNRPRSDTLRGSTWNGMKVSGFEKSLLAF